MKALVCTADIDKRGGVATFFRSLRGKFGVEVEYFFLGARTESESGVSSLFRFAKDNVRFVRTLWRGHYDIVHLNPSLDVKSVIRDGLLLVLARPFKSKVVVFFHGWDPSFQQTIVNRYNRLFRFVFSRADAFIVLASEFKENLTEMGFTQPVYQATTLVDDNLFYHVYDQQPNYRLEKADNPPVILFLSRVEKTKGIYEALEAYRLLKKRHRNATLVVAGEGPDLTDAIEHARRIGIEDVKFVGYLDGHAKARAFLEADVYLFPSYMEGMPISVLEAMAFGLPVVTRGVGGINDFFEDGKMGFVTNSYDPNVFAQLLERLIVDGELRRRIGSYNHDYARTNFVASEVAKQVERVYKAVSNL